MKNIKQSKKGAVLILTIMIITVLTIMASGLFVVTNSSTSTYKRVISDKQDFWAAEAGLNWGKKYIKRALYTQGSEHWKDVKKTLNHIEGHSIQVLIDVHTDPTAPIPEYWTITSKVYDIDTDGNKIFKKRMVLNYLIQDNPFKYAYFFPKGGASFSSKKDGTDKDIVYGQMYVRDKVGISYLPEFRAKVTSAAPAGFTRLMAKSETQYGNKKARTILAAERMHTMYGSSWNYDHYNQNVQTQFLQSVEMEKYNWGITYSKAKETSDEYLKTSLDDNIFKGGFQSLAAEISTPDIFETYEEIEDDDPTNPDDKTINLSTIFDKLNIDLPTDITSVDDKELLFDSETNKMPYRLKFEGNKMVIYQSDAYDANGLPGNTDSKDLDKMRTFVNYYKAEMTNDHSYKFGIPYDPADPTNSANLTEAETNNNNTVLATTFYETDNHIYTSKTAPRNSVYSDSVFNKETGLACDPDDPNAVFGTPASTREIPYSTILEFEQVLNEYNIIENDAAWGAPIGTYNIPSDLKGIIVDEAFSGKNYKGRNGRRDMIDEYWEHLAIKDDGSVDHMYGKPRSPDTGNDRRKYNELHDANEIFIDGDIGQSMTLVTHGSDIKIWDDFIPSTFDAKYPGGIANGANIDAATIAEDMSTDGIKLMVLAGHFKKNQWDNSRKSFIGIHSNKSNNHNGEALIFGAIASNFSSTFKASYLDSHALGLVDMYLVGSVMSGSKKGLKGYYWRDKDYKGLKLFAITNPRYVLGDLPPFGKSTVFIDPYITEADNKDDAKFGSLLDGYTWDMMSTEN